MNYRIEKDELGEFKVPKNVYYGSRTLRGKQNFSLSKTKLNKDLISCLAIIKKSIAATNENLSLIDKETYETISLACDELINGKFYNQFIATYLDSASDYTMNMNVSEVIANYSNELLGFNLGEYTKIDTINHVNLNQNSENIVNSAVRLSFIYIIKNILIGLTRLTKEIKTIIKHTKQSPEISDFYKKFNKEIQIEIKRLEKQSNTLRTIDITIDDEFLDYNSHEYSKKVCLNISKFSKIQVINSLDNEHKSNKLLDFGILSDSLLKISELLLRVTKSHLKIMKNSNFLYFQNTLLFSEKESIETYFYNNVLIANKQIEGNDNTIKSITNKKNVQTNLSQVVYYNLFDSVELILSTIEFVSKKIIKNTII